MKWNEVKAMYQPVLEVPGDPNLWTRATKKNHIHKVNPAAKRSNQPSSHAFKREYDRQMEAKLKARMELHETNRLSGNNVVS